MTIFMRVTQPARIANPVGHRLEIMDQSKPAHQLEQVVADVDLPPVKPLAGRAGKVVMIVVPTFAQRQQGQQPVVAAVIACAVAASAPAVGQRVDGQVT
jgi:hypothetical protein